MDYKPLPDEKPFLRCLTGVAKHQRDKVNCIYTQGGYKEMHIASNFAIHKKRKEDILQFGIAWLPGSSRLGQCILVYIDVNIYSTYR